MDILSNYSSPDFYTIVTPEGEWTFGQKCAIKMGYIAGELFLSMFYILSPNATTFYNAHDVPNYNAKVVPMVALFIIIEQIIRFFQRKHLSRLQDIVINSFSGFIFALSSVILLTVLITALTYVYDNYRIFELKLNSVWTWILSLILVEFMYYWTHRAHHEINILWAIHQYHHQAEDINISTTARTSIGEFLSYDLYTLPLALIIPPPILLVHKQFTLIYNIWLHNEVVGNLGFLEYIVNTPAQHRVHHAKNPRCIDKNYGALFMVWDRIFGTHQTEYQENTYGVVSPSLPKTNCFITLQTNYYFYAWKKLKSMDGLWNKIFVLIKGPGWAPGKPRLGLISDVPEPDPTEPKYSYNPYIPMWKQVYVLGHAGILAIGYYSLADHPMIRYTHYRVFIGILYLMFALICFGAIFDKKKLSPLMEIVRCITYLLFDRYIISNIDSDMSVNKRYMLYISLWIVRLFHILSIMLWVWLYIKNKDEVHNIGENELISEISATKHNHCATVAFLLILAAMGVSTLLAFATSIDECSQFINSL